MPEPKAKGLGLVPLGIDSTIKDNSLLMTDSFVVQGDFRVPADILRVNARIAKTDKTNLHTPNGGPDSGLSAKDLNLIIGERFDHLGWLVGTDAVVISVMQTPMLPALSEAPENVPGKMVRSLSHSLFQLHVFQQNRPIFNAHRATDDQLQCFCSTLQRRQYLLIAQLERCNFQRLANGPLGVSRPGQQGQTLGEILIGMVKGIDYNVITQVPLQVGPGFAFEVFFELLTPIGVVGFWKHVVDLEE